MVVCCWASNCPPLWSRFSGPFPRSPMAPITPSAFNVTKPWWKLPWTMGSRRMGNWRRGVHWRPRCCCWVGVYSRISRLSNGKRRHKFSVKKIACLIKYEFFKQKYVQRRVSQQSWDKWLNMVLVRWTLTHFCVNVASQFLSFSYTSTIQVVRHGEKNSQKINQKKVSGQKINQSINYGDLHGGCQRILCALSWNGHKALWGRYLSSVFGVETSADTDKS